jgi:hypothetical protein
MLKVDGDIPKSFSKLDTNTEIEIPGELLFFLLITRRETHNTASR